MGVDVAIPFDADPTADYLLDFDRITVGANSVLRSKIVLVDGTTNNKVVVDGSGNLQVKLGSGSLVDASSRGVNGSTPAAATATNTSGILVSAGSGRRAVWLTNASLLTADIVWLALGAVVAVANKGIPLYPGQTIQFDASPNMEIRGISAGAASVTIPLAFELD